METEKKGKTLWEMLCERVRAQGNGAGIAFYNPLDLRIGAQEFHFTDYALRGISTKSFDAAQAMVARLRAVPNPAGAYDTLLLRLEDEFAFSEDFLGVVQDTTGIFEVVEDKSGAKDTFSRINDLRESYEAAVLAVAATTADGKAVPDKTSPARIEYWDYWRDLDIGDGHLAKEF